MADNTIAYVRTEYTPAAPPPPSTIGVQGWLWENIFSSMTKFSTLSASLGSIGMIILTFGAFYFGLSVLWNLLDFSFFSATWSDPDGLKREACRPNHGACWPFIWAKLKLIFYGRYPSSELWRVNIVYILLALGLVWLVIERLPYRGIVSGLMLTVFPLVAFILLTGGNADIGWTFWTVWALIGLGLIGLGWIGGKGEAGDILEAFSGALLAIGIFFLALAIVVFISAGNFGMEFVETANWGGFLVTLVVALTGIVASLPLGILLALGRRSNLPIIKLLSVIFIEFWRGVPLITVLFMSSVMLPLFLPEGTSFDKLLRALIGVGLFSAAYMAEVVRGGLQAMPKGQYEGAMALGLPYWKMMRLIILPQALTTVIPGIVNTFIGLFKDTVLVLIIGLFDLLGIVEFAKRDASWSTPVTSETGYLVAGFIFWICCFSMSRYSVKMEEKLHTGHAR